MKGDGELLDLLLSFCYRSYDLRSVTPGKLPYYLDLRDDRGAS